MSSFAPFQRKRAKTSSSVEQPAQILPPSRSFEPPKAAPVSESTSPADWQAQMERATRFGYSIARLAIHDPAATPQGPLAREANASTGQREANDGLARLPVSLMRMGASSKDETIQRVKEKKVGAVKVPYAENEGEALTLCKVEAEKQELDWDQDFDDGARETILNIAQKAADLQDKDVAGGLPAAYKLIHSHKREQEKRVARQERRAEIEKQGGEYERLKGQIEGDELLEACVDWMKDIYIQGGAGEENRTLGKKFTREEIQDAVKAWKDENNWASQKLKIVKNLHGYAVGPKAQQVGDTLDKRGDQGNIIASWGGTKINIHINPSD